MIMVAISRISQAERRSGDEDEEDVGDDDDDGDQGDYDYGGDKQGEPGGEANWWWR